MEQNGRLPLDDDIPLLQESLLLIGDRADRLVSSMYARLFVAEPSMRTLFPVSMQDQRERFFRELSAAVRQLGEPETLEPLLAQLGREHRRFGVLAEHYEPFGAALIGALRDCLDEIWVPELEAAWWRAYNFFATVMIEGAEESADREPAWWKAEVVDHDRRTDDIAVIRLSTDRPYPYVAGQYAAVETPYRPRSWRTYSLANAPSPDGMLELHVRAVGAGWVSGPLVWRARPGDIVRLGAATGDMVVDQSSERDLLLIAGGTGLAPLKAVVEDLARWNTSRRVHLFFGARRPDEALHDLPALDRLAARHRWLTVLPVVSDDDRYHGLKGLLPSVVAQQGPWDDHDVLVCGPPAMVRATVARLHERVPPDQIRYDVYREIHPASAQVIDLRRSRASRTVGTRRRSH